MLKTRVTNLVRFYAIIALVTSLHTLLVPLQNLGPLRYVYWLLPALSIFGCGLHFSKEENTPTKVALENTLLIWTLVSLFIHSVFLHWSLTEILFLMSILYAHQNIASNRFIQTKTFVIASGFVMLSIIGHTWLNARVTAFSYAHPSGTIMSIGAIALFLLTHWNIQQVHQKKNEAIAEEKSDKELIQSLLKSLGHSLRNPLATAQLKLDIAKLKHPDSNLLKELNAIHAEINKVSALYGKIEHTYNKKAEGKTVLEVLTYDLEGAEIKISGDIQEGKLKPSSAQLHNTILKVLVENALEHGKGGAVVSIDFDQQGFRYSVANEGQFFQPDKYRGAFDQLNPALNANNRIGNSLNLIQAIAASLNYCIDYEPYRNGSGTKVIVSNSNHA